MFIALLIVLSFQIINAQEKDEINLITSGKWYIEYMEMSGKKMALSPEIQKNNWVIFHKDGKQEGMEEGRKYVGKWKFDKKNRILKTNDLDGKSEQRLISVSKRKLVISVKEKGVEIFMGMRK